jgi:hypothetical protein
VTWSPAWAIWLCPECRQRRTEAELHGALAPAMDAAS